MSDVFLSYSREDQAIARRFAEGLDSEGFSVWWDQALAIGEAFDQITERALGEASAVVVLWSRKSVDSRWVRAEATQAQSSGRLAPVMIEACKRPIMFELTQTADLAGWNGDRSEARWRSFIDGLSRFVEKGKLAPATAGATVATALPSVPVSRGISRTPVVWAAAVAGMLAVAAGLLWFSQGREARTLPAAATPLVAASIAVLPFRDMSQNKDQEYFADGVTEEILNTLAGLKDLKVTARTSAFAFKGKDVDLRTVGETLGVQHILEGSIRKDGETLRITAQLIDAKSDGHVWSKTYDRTLKDIFEVQEDIARSVAEALQVTLGVGFGSQPGMTRNVDAYDAALASWPLTLQQTAETHRRAIGLLEKAVALDPAFGQAWARLAVAYGGMSGYAPQDKQAWQEKADAAIGRALQLKPVPPLIHGVLAELSIGRTRWSEAAGHYEDLVAEFSARGAPVPFSNGRFLLMMGQAREALAVLEADRARDPLNPEASFFLAVTHSAVRDFPAATAEFERGQTLNANWRYLFQIAGLSNALAIGDRADIRRRMEVLNAGTPVTQQTLSAQLLSLLDRPDDALAYLREQTRDPSTPGTTMQALSQFLAYFGDPQAALEAQRLAFERGGVVQAISSTWYPLFREVRKLPEFKQLVRDIGLVDYWREYGWGDFCKPTTGEDFECT